MTTQSPLPPRRNPTRAALVAALAAALLAGCGLPTLQPAPVLPALPAQWSQMPTATGDAPVQAWWLPLHDAALDALIGQALRSNRDVARSALRWQQAALQARVAGLDRWPKPAAGFNASARRSLSGSGATTVLVNGVSVPVPSLPTVSTSYGASVSASYEVDLWARVALSQALARDAAAASQADLDTARWLITTKVAEQYWTLAAIDAKAELASAATRDAQASLAATRLRHEVGKLRAADVVKAELALGEARLRAQALATQRVEATHALALLLDRVPEALNAPAARLPEGDPPEALATAPASLLDRRPDLRSARLALDAALHKLNLAEASRYPQLTLTASLSGGGEALRQVLANPIGSLGLGLAIPLVDWQRAKAAREQAELQLQEAAITFREALYKALVEVETQFAQRRQLATELTQARHRRLAADEVLAIARLRYDNGAEAQQAVRDAEQAQRDATSAVLDLRLKNWLNLVAIQKSLGGPIVAAAN